MKRRDRFPAFQTTARDDTLTSRSPTDQTDQSSAPTVCSSAPPAIVEAPSASAVQQAHHHAASKPLAQQRRRPSHQNQNPPCATTSITMPRGAADPSRLPHQQPQQQRASGASRRPVHALLPHAPDVVAVIPADAVLHRPRGPPSATRVLCSSFRADDPRVSCKAGNRCPHVHADTSRAALHRVHVMADVQQRMDGGSEPPTPTPSACPASDGSGGSSGVELVPPVAAQPSWAVVEALPFPCVIDPASEAVRGDVVYMTPPPQHQQPHGKAALVPCLGVAARDHHNSPPREGDLDFLPVGRCLQTLALAADRRPLSHCAHWVRKGRCNLGASCSFVHYVPHDAPAAARTN